MKRSLFLLTLVMLSLFSNGQPGAKESDLKTKKESAIRTAVHNDSVRIEKQFALQEKLEKIKPKIEYPLLKAGDFSGVVPVKYTDEVPDVNMDYKLLFELTYNNPDSIAGEINGGLNEIIRIINLHVASGIPLKKIIPVIVVHGEALVSISNNSNYQKAYNLNNPNISLINDLVNKTGARFIACGQAMAVQEVNKEDLLPGIKISLTAQTVLSNYQLKGYVLYKINEVK